MENENIKGDLWFICFFSGFNFCGCCLIRLFVKIEVWVSGGINYEIN